MTSELLRSAEAAGLTCTGVSPHSAWGKVVHLSEGPWKWYLEACPLAVGSEVALVSSEVMRADTESDIGKARRQ